MRFTNNIYLVFNWLLLISITFSASSSFSQSNLDAPVNYEARDSIVANIRTEVVKLYGAAIVNYDGIQLEADYIEIDLKHSEVLATYSLDSIGNPVGKPLFTAEGEETRCDYMKYNFKTKKGYIKEVRAQQEDGYIHMAESKIHPNEQIHLNDGKYTTCDLDTPHYHFKMSKAIIVPDERIVTGPVYMKIFKIPTPLAAPFAFFPQSDSRKQGFIPPEFASALNGAGFGLKDFGYYIPLGDYWETQFMGSIFTTGQWAAANTTNYYKKYKYRGSMGLRFEQLRGYFHENLVTNKTSVNWNHAQDQKAHPTLTFGADINYISDNNGKTSLNPVNPDYFTSQFNSSISLSQRWKTKKFSGSSSLKAALKQNSITEQYTLNLPTFSFTVSRFDFGVLRKNKIGKKWYENIQVQYKLNAENLINAPDSIFNPNDFAKIGDYARNGVEHLTTVNSQLKLFGARLNFSPSVTYREIWNFQYENHYWSTLDNSIDTTAVNGFKSGRNMSFSGQLSGNFYGLYKFKGKSNTRFKHVASPQISMSYAPDLGLFQTIQSDTTGKTVDISPFITSRYRELSAGESATLNFSLINTLKMKKLDKKDTINGSSKAFNLIDAANINGSFDFLRDSLKLSNLALSLRTSKFLGIFTFQSRATLSPYLYDSLGNRYIDYKPSGEINKEYAWQNKEGVGRITTADFTINANFTSANGRKKQKELLDVTAEDGQATDIVSNPGTVNFEIPWQVNLAYNLNMTAVVRDSLEQDSYRLVQTLGVTGDFSINKKWKFIYGVAFDLQQFNPKYQSDITQPLSGLVTRWNLDITRDLHCWEAALSLGQLGPYKGSLRETNYTFLFRVNIKASMLQAIKGEYKKQYFFNWL